VPAKFEAPSESENNAPERISQVNDAMKSFAELIEEGMEGMKSMGKKEFKKKLHRNRQRLGIYISLMSMIKSCDK
jgi:hypothetical protein